MARGGARIAGAGADPETSYTARLLAQGIERVAQKVGEEGVETAIAAVSAPHSWRARTAERGKPWSARRADLLYHLLVLLQASGVDPSEVGMSSFGDTVWPGRSTRRADSIFDAVFGGHPMIRGDRAGRAGPSRISASSWPTA